MEKYTMLMDWKNQYSENEYTTQSNLQIQRNPYQATNSILHRARTNNFTICMEKQKTSNSQSDLEKEDTVAALKELGLAEDAQKVQHCGLETHVRENLTAPWNVENS